MQMYIRGYICTSEYMHITLYKIYLHNIESGGWSSIHVVKEVPALGGAFYVNPRDSRKSLSAGTLRGSFHFCTRCSRIQNATAEPHVRYIAYILYDLSVAQMPRPPSCIRRCIMYYRIRVVITAS